MDLIKFVTNENTCFTLSAGYNYETMGELVIIRSAH